MKLRKWPLQFGSIFLFLVSWVDGFAGNKVLFTIEATGATILWLFSVAIEEEPKP